MNLSNTWLIATCLTALDQAAKWIVLLVLDLPATGTLTLVPGFLEFVLAWNTGINFGLLSSKSPIGQWFLVAIAITISLGLSWWIRNGADNRRQWGVALIVGGAFGNAIDRVIHGAVVDFINVSGFGIDNPFSFNIADILVFMGAGLIALSTSQKPEDRGEFDQRPPS